jgi:hypothetical protein
MEFRPGKVNPIDLPGAAKSPAQPLLHREVEEHAKVRLETHRRHPVDGQDFAQWKPATARLVGKRRVDEPVTHNGSAALERRQDHLTDMLGARCREEQRFRLGQDSTLHLVQKNCPNPLSGNGSTGFAGDNHRIELLAKPLCQPRRLSRLAGAFRSFERDKQAPHRLPHTFREEFHVPVRLASSTA